MFNILIDDLKMESDMPVIADFESVNTLSRWEIKHVSRFEIDNQFYTQGLSSVLVEFEKAKYP